MEFDRACDGAGRPRGRILGTGCTAGPTNESCRPRDNSSVLDVDDRRTLAVH